MAVWLASSWTWGGLGSFTGAAESFLDFPGFLGAAGFAFSVLEETLFFLLDTEHLSGERQADDLDDLNFSLEE